MGGTKGNHLHATFQAKWIYLHVVFGGIYYHANLVNHPLETVSVEVTLKNAELAVSAEPPHQLEEAVATSVVRNIV